MAEAIVVTGLGVVSSLGHQLDAFWTAICEGRSGIGPVRCFDTSAYDVHVGGEVVDFDPAGVASRLDLGSVGRATGFAIAAASAAVADAGLGPDQIAGERTGVSMGTTSGEPREVERYNDLVLAGKVEAIGAELVERYPCHSIATGIAADLDLAGPNLMVPTACAAGNYAVAQAMERLRTGEADLMLAGGADAFSRITYTGFARLGAIAPERCQPFDLHRKGMIPGEGAAVLVLETAARARARGARIYARLLGYGLSCDAYHMTGGHPEGDGAARAIRTAMADSGINAEDVDYVCAHGTGTPSNDRTETRAIRAALGEAASRTPVSSIKSMLGHTMGAASAIESLVCALAIHHSVVPPTANFETPDPECDLDCVPNIARETPVAVALNNAAAFGGNNACLVLGDDDGSR
jgi:3-oxoacyl-[acyl-carrier-protein] synthase II